MTDSAEYLKEHYRLREADINRQLAACAERGRTSDRDELFRYLCLNLLSVQANWCSAKTAIIRLEKDGHLFNGDIDSVHGSLRAAKYRGRGNADRIVNARHKFYDKSGPQFEIGIETLVFGLRGNVSTPNERRQTLKDAVSGFGLKTASHFLRGVSLSENQLAILDTHVVNQLLEFRELALRADGLVRFNEKGKLQHAGRRRYLEIERRLIPWANKRIGIPLDALDLLLWRLGRERVSLESCSPKGVADED